MTKRCQLICWMMLFLFLCGVPVPAVEQTRCDPPTPLIPPALRFDGITNDQAWMGLSTERTVSGLPTLRTCYYHTARKLKVTVAVDLPRSTPALRAAPAFRASVVMMPTGVEVVSKLGRLSNGQGQLLCDVPELREGKYAALVEILDTTGQVLTVRRDTFIVRRYPWEHNQVGTEKIVVKPFTPVRVNGQTLRVWGRTYTFADTALCTSLIAKEQELLGSPMRLEGEVNGKSGIFVADGPPKWTHRTDYHATLTTHGSLAGMPVTMTADTEYDGTISYLLTYAPAGLTRITRLDLVIPLRDATGWQAMRDGRELCYGTAPLRNGIFWQSTALPVSTTIHGAFLPYCYLGDGERGLAWAADSDRGWLLVDNKAAFQLERQHGEVAMRARIVNTPAVLTDLRSIRFMLQALPEKPYPTEYRYRMWGTDNAPSSQQAGRLGNDRWSYGAGPTMSFQTDDQYAILHDSLEADRVHMSANTAQAMDLTFTPLSCCYAATDAMGLAMPEYDTYAGEWLGVTHAEPNVQAEYSNYINAWGAWSDPRRQSRVPADLTPSVIDLRVYYYDQMQRRAGLNGFWWDHARFWASGNLINGSAYVRDDGKTQGVYNIGAMREMMRRMAVVAELNGVLPFQGSYAYCTVGPIASFMQFQCALTDSWNISGIKGDQLDHINGGLDGLKVLLARYTGAPVTIYSDMKRRDPLVADEAQMRCCLGIALLMDVGVGSGVNDDQTRRHLLDVLRAIDYYASGNTWVPYWRTDTLVRCSDARAVVTVYQCKRPDQPARALLVVFNGGDTAIDVKLQTVDSKLLGKQATRLWDAETAREIARDDQHQSMLTLKRHDFHLLVLE